MTVLLDIILHRRERDSYFGKDWPSLTNFRRKKLLKSEFVHKMRIKYVAFNSFYHEQKFNYLCQMLALQHWENCQCLPSSEIIIPTVKYRTAPYGERYELRVTSWKLKSTSWNSKVQVMTSNPQVTSSNARVTSSNPRVIKSMRIQVNSPKNSWFPDIISPKLFGNSWDNSFVQFLVIICFRFSLFHGYVFSRKMSKWTITLKEET